MDTAASINSSHPRPAPARVKRGMAEMLKGGVIMDVVTPEQARASPRQPGGGGHGARTGARRYPRPGRGGPNERSDMIEGIISAVTIPVMAKARIGHFVEAQILQSPRGGLRRRVRGAHAGGLHPPHRQVEVHRAVRLRRHQPGRGAAPITEGAAMIRSKGEAGTGDVSNATTHMRTIGGRSGDPTSLSEDELFVAAKEPQAPYDLVVERWPGPASCR